MLFLLDCLLSSAGEAVCFTTTHVNIKQKNNNNIKDHQYFAIHNRIIDWNFHKVCAQMIQDYR